MAQRSGLFDSTEIVEVVNGFPKGNRAETADFFARYFASFVGNGIFASPSTNYQVMSISGLTVQIRAGACFINGYFAFDNEIETKTFDGSANTMEYWLVQRLDLTDGTITKTWVTNPGTGALPQRTGTIYDLVIAKVVIPGNAESITDSAITDYRYNTNYCGIVTGLIEQLDTTTIAQQLQSYTDEFADYTAQAQAAFNLWFATITNILDSNVAASLENKKNDRLYAVCESAGTAKTVSIDNFILATGQTIHIHFVNAVGAGDTLNISGTGAKDITKSGIQPVVAGDIPAAYTAFLVYNGTAYELLNPAPVHAISPGMAFYTEPTEFVVPRGITAVKVSACASGVDNYAGEFIIDYIINVEPGEVIPLTIGWGNTVIGGYKTLIAGSFAGSYPNDKLGYLTGYNGGLGGSSQVSGYGGAYGYGGGGTGRYTTTDMISGGGGGGIGGAGGSSLGGGSSGGDGGVRITGDPYSYFGMNAKVGEPIYPGQKENVDYGGGDGSIYGAGGSGGGRDVSSPAGATGGGGGAGGYGAGGGQSYGVAQGILGFGSPSPGMVLIEWGVTMS